MQKIKIVIDTNVFVSAYLGSKNARLLLKEIINNEYQLVMSKEQLKELEDVLKRKKFSKYISYDEVDELINLLSLSSIMPAIYEKITDCRDPKDNMILEAAVFGNARYIVSGDEDLLVLNPYRWINIVNLNQFLREMYDL